MCSDKHLMQIELNNILIVYKISQRKKLQLSPNFFITRT